MNLNRFKSKNFIEIFFLLSTKPTFRNQDDKDKSMTFVLLVCKVRLQYSSKLSFCLKTPQLYKGNQIHANFNQEENLVLLFKAIPCIGMFS